MVAKTTRKASTKNTVSKKTVSPARPRRERKPAVPMTQEVRVAGAAALAAFEEKLLDQEGVGFVGSSSRELKGTRSGFQKTVRMEDEDGKRTSAVITVVFKERAARKPRAKKATSKKRTARNEEE